MNAPAHPSTPAQRLAAYQRAAAWRIRWFVAGVIALALLIAYAAKAEARDYPCEVIRAIDGDTVVVNIDLGLHVAANLIHVRLANANAPERGNEAGEAARKWMVAFAAGKKGVLHTTDGKEFDKYGRVLARLEIAGVDAGEALIESGNGHGGPGRKDPAP
jgi:endonuclease YncB( thermonuclease family)